MALLRRFLGKLIRHPRLRVMAGFLGVVGCWGLPTAVGALPTVVRHGANIVLQNGLVRASISTRSGNATSLALWQDGRWVNIGLPRESIYFDCNGNAGLATDGKPMPGGRGFYCGLGGVRLGPRVRHTGSNIVDLSLVGGPSRRLPFHFEAHYVMQRGLAGLYVYVTVHHGAVMPPSGFDQSRYVLRGYPHMFTEQVLPSGKVKPFALSPVVRKVQDATFLLRNGHVYTKYNNSIFEKENTVYGMIGHGIGAWVITPSTEFINGGPTRQELSVHEDGRGQLLLAMLQGMHFGAGAIRLKANEIWTHVWGPVLFYFNRGQDAHVMYRDALRQYHAERSEWPYAWARSRAYSVGRGWVGGTLRLLARRSTTAATLVLAAPGQDWTQQAGGYIYWTGLDCNGRFRFKKVQPGTYELYAYGGNHFHQFKLPGVVVRPGEAANLGRLAWPPAPGEVLWQIGIADRSTREFRHGDNVRHWGNFRFYHRDFPNDVNYIIDKSTPEKDWNYAQWSWYNKKPYWAIHFTMAHALVGTATLTFGICGSSLVNGHSVILDVLLNGKRVGLLTLRKSGAAAYRSGGSDSRYRVRQISFPAELIKPGPNTFHLHIQGAQRYPHSHVIARQFNVGCIMYDAIRLSVEP
ncbi:MAG: hypothetical protein HKL96_12035 [Phycisphaerales bacterium]|nr:hypothetical protein [Phycisphaerales bacterium]